MNNIRNVSRETDSQDLPFAEQARLSAEFQTKKRIPSQHKKTNHIVCVTNQKGGVGKTTSVVNIASSLYHLGFEVLVIDLDPQGNASTALGISPEQRRKTIYDIFIEGDSIENVLQPSYLPGLWCIPSTLDAAGIELEISRSVNREFILRDALVGGERKFHFIFIDCPPSLGLLTVNALTAAHEVLIPIQCEYYALEGVSQLVKTIESMRETLNTKLVLRHILLTMFDQRTRLSHQVVEEVNSFFKEIVLTTKIPRSIKVAEAPGYEQSVIDYDYASRGAQAYMNAAEEFLSRYSFKD